MAKKHTEQCACGAIKFEFYTDPTFIAVCHCLDCKRSTGGEAATFFAVPDDDFTLISGKPKAFHYVAQSGKGRDRNFCPDCGARVFSSNLEGFPGTISSRSVAWITLGASSPCLRCSLSAASHGRSRSICPSLRTCRADSRWHTDTPKIQNLHAALNGNAQHFAGPNPGGIA